jgi:hypothetical protein
MIRPAASHGNHNQGKRSRENEQILVPTQPSRVQRRPEQANHALAFRRGTEANIEHIPILHHVFLAFQPQAASGPRLIEAAGFD